MVLDRFLRQRNPNEQAAVDMYQQQDEFRGQTEPELPQDKNPDPRQEPADNTPQQGQQSPEPQKTFADRKVLKHRMNSSSDVPFVEVCNDDKIWRPLTAEEADQYLDLDEWKRRHPDETPPADKFPTDFQEWTDADEAAEVAARASVISTAPNTPQDSPPNTPQAQVGNPQGLIDWAQQADDDPTFVGRGNARPAGGPQTGAPQQRGPRAQPQAPTQPEASPYGEVPRFIKRRFSNPIPRQEPAIRQQSPTLDVVLKDDKKREDLFELLQARGRTDLIDKFHRSKNDPSAMVDQDWHDMDEQLLETDRRWLLEAEVKDNMTAEDIRYMLDKNPSFAALRASLKPERAAEVIKAHLHTTFMRASDEEVDRMVFAQRANRDIRGSRHYNGLKERTQARLGIIGISPENVDWNKVNPLMIRQILRPGVFSLLQSRQKAGVTHEAVAANLNDLGNILGASLKSDVALHARMIHEVETGEKVPETIITGVKTLQEATRGKEAATRALDLPMLRASVPAFRQSYEQRFGRTWESDSPAVRKDNFMNAVERHEAQRQRTGSWFGALIAALIGVLTSRAREDDQLNTALATA